jgi:hypothetical protein
VTPVWKSEYLSPLPIAKTGCMEAREIIIEEIASAIFFI